MFVYKQLHTAAAIICAVATLMIAPDAALHPHSIANDSDQDSPRWQYARVCCQYARVRCRHARGHSHLVSDHPHLARVQVHPARASSHPVRAQAHPVRAPSHLVRVHSKVGFVARNSDCQACNNDCKPRNHYFPPRNQNKHHLHPCRKGLSLCCMGGDGDDGNGCGAANGLCISFILTNSSYLYNIVA